MEKYSKEDFEDIGKSYFEAKWKYKMRGVRFFLGWFIIFPILLYGLFWLVIIIFFGASL